MDPSAYRKGLLERKYEEHFEQAEQLRRDDRKQRAATRYEKAADVLEKLDETDDTDRSEEIERLQRAASILQRGEDLSTYMNQDATATGQSQSEDETGGSPEAEEATEDEEAVRRRIQSFISETDTTWADIGGLEDVVTQLKRSVALGAVGNKPSAVSATDRILLFGPPGTGKTLLASAVAGSLDATFFQVELGNLLSKYYGESSKQISALFEVAEELSPSVIFLDEVDSLTQSRDGGMNDTSRRVLDTLLAELDGLDKSNDSFVLTLAATNTPWSLDSAIRSRFPQRIMVPLPDVDAATDIVKIHTVGGGVSFTGDPSAFIPGGGEPRQTTSVPRAIAAECVRDGYTGRDLEAHCQRSVSNMVYRENPALESLVDDSLAHLRDHDLEVGPIVPADVIAAFESTTPSIPEDDVADHYEWNQEYGSFET